MYGQTAVRDEAGRKALDAERRALVVEQQRFETLPGAQAFGGAGARVEADQGGGGVVDVQSVAGGVAQNDADAHALVRLRRRRGQCLIVAMFVGHGTRIIGQEGLRQESAGENWPVRHSSSAARRRAGPRRMEPRRRSRGVRYTARS